MVITRCYRCVRGFRGQARARRTHSRPAQPAVLACGARHAACAATPPPLQTEGEEEYRFWTSSVDAWIYTCVVVVNIVMTMVLYV
eukprot:7001446-Prymnesium_polylepis.1